MPESVILLPKFKAKQQQVYDSIANEILFAGDTRAGKSFFVRRSYINWCSQIPGLLCDIFRVNFDDVIHNYMEGETSFPVLLSQWEKDGLVKINQTEIVFWNGSRIFLEHCADDKVMRKHQGVARHVRTLDESAQILEHRIRALTGWVTMSAEMLSRVPAKWAGQFPKMLHLTNFVGPAMGYYRRGFLEAREPYEIEKVGQFNRTFIPAYLTDNDSEDAETTKARIREAFPDVAIQKALLECDWRAVAGDFYPEWNEAKHVVKDFQPPTHWFTFRGLDLGYAEPCCVLWCCVSDGEPFRDDNDQERWFPRGAFIIYREWYLCDEREPWKGLRYRNEDIRDGIIARSDVGHERDVTLTDSLPFQDRGGVSVPTVFSNAGHGITLTLGDTSRIPGWNMLRSKLIGFDYAGERIPMIYVTESCRYVRQYMPALQRHKSEGKAEDAQEHGEATHACDTMRLISMAHTRIKDQVEPMESRIVKELKASRPTMKKLAPRLFK